MNSSSLFWHISRKVTSLSVVVNRSSFASSASTIVNYKCLDISCTIVLDDKWDIKLVLFHMKCKVVNNPNYRDCLTYLYWKGLVWDPLCSWVNFQIPPKQDRCQTRDLESGVSVNSYSVDKWLIGCILPKPVNANRARKSVHVVGSVHFVIHFNVTLTCNFYCPNECLLNCKERINFETCFIAE
jgi:hypothetical protein